MSSRASVLVRYRPLVSGVVLFFLTLLFSVSAANSAVYLVPFDHDMINGADMIVAGRVVAISSRVATDGMIVSDVTISVDEVLKGELEGSELTIVEEGGIVGNRARLVSAAPAYFVGEQGLVVVASNPQRGRSTWGMALGRFTSVVGTDGLQYYVRAARSDEIFGWDVEGNRHVERPRLAGEFLDYIRSSVAGIERPVDYFPPVSPKIPRVPDIDPAPGGSVPPAVEESGAKITTLSHYPPSAYLMAPFRWSTFDSGGSATFYVSGTQTGLDSIGAAQRGLAGWTNEAGSNIRYVYGGTRTTTFGENGTNGIIYNATSGVPAGAIAYSQAFAGNQHVYKGETLYTIYEGDVIVKAGVPLTQAKLDEAVMHELGHTLGFRHSNEGTPASSAAVMYASVSGAYGAVPQAWDREAAQHVYTGTTSSQTFADVPPSHPFYQYIETLVRNGITGGCGGGNYCPDAPVTRAQMAIFLLTSKRGTSYSPPTATGTMFSDVPAGAFAAAWIEELARSGVTGGCGGGRYCPNDYVTRQQMAVFLLAMKYGSAYRPPAATGMFSDVPVSSPYAPWIEQLAREGITGGCTATMFCPTQLVTRGQMAVFLVSTFGLR